MQHITSEFNNLKYNRFVDTLYARFYLGKPELYYALPMSLMLKKSPYILGTNINFPFVYSMLGFVRWKKKVLLDRMYLCHVLYFILCLKA